MSKKSPQKVKITVWANPDVVDYINHEAASRSITRSEAANALLETAFVESRDLVGAELISVALRKKLDQEFAGLANRLANLLARSALEAIAGRYMAYQAVAQLSGEDQAKGTNRAAWNFAVNQLRRPSREFRELLRAWREGELEDEQNGH